MAEIKVLKDEVLNVILRNELLRIPMAESLGIKPNSILALARYAKKNKVRNRLCDVEVIKVLKKELNYKSIDDLFEVVKL